MTEYTMPTEKEIEAAGVVVRYLQTFPPITEDKPLSDGWRMIAKTVLEAAEKVRMDNTVKFFADIGELPDRPKPPKRRPWGSRPRQG